MSRGEDEYDRLKLAAETEHGRRIKKARTLPSPQRQAATQAANAQIRLDFQAAQEAWTRIDSGQE